MNENNELLQLIYENANMGAKSLTNLLNDIKDKDNKVKKIVSEEIKSYEKIFLSAEKLLKKNKVEPKGKGIIADVMSSMGIKNEVSKDNSDSAIAEMIIEGFTMGNLEISKTLNNYKENADKKIVDLANKLLAFGNDEIEKLKKFI